MDTAHGSGVGVPVDVLHVASAAALEYAASVDGRRVAPDDETRWRPRRVRRAVARRRAPTRWRRCDCSHDVGGPATDGHRPAPATSASSTAPRTRSRSAQCLARRGVGPERRAAGDVARSPPRCTTSPGAGCVDLLRLPAGDRASRSSRGATVANASCLAAARDALLARLGWDVQRRRPVRRAARSTVVIGERAHSHAVASRSGSSGSAARRVVVVPADDQGRMRADRAARRRRAPCWSAPRPARSTPARSTRSTRSPTGSPSAAVGCTSTARSGCGRSPTRRGPTSSRGLDRADSWATDGHKWLNVTYDCGIAFVRRPADLRRTFAALAGYLPPATSFEAMHHTPQSSQRARQIEVWAVLRTLGRDGVADLVTRCVRRGGGDRRPAARRRAHDPQRRRAQPGARAATSTARRPSALIAEIQADGRIWCGPTQWGGATAMRISVSSWKTDLDDAALAADVILDCANRVHPRR